MSAAEQTSALETAMAIAERLAAYQFAGYVLTLDSERIVTLAAEVRRLREACGGMEADAKLLDFLESQGQGRKWIARDSITGRGYRLHQANDASHPTARAAIAAAMAAALSNSQEV